VCSDGVAEGTEQCDGLDLNEQTCTLLGLGTGTLSCNGDCTFNTSLCVLPECADGLDNDGDGFIDMADPGCTAADDTSESIYATSCHGTGGTIYDATFADTSQDVFITGSTVGAPSVFTPTDGSGDCSTNASNSGPELVFFYRNFTYKSPVYFTLDTATTNYDTVLYVRQADCLNPTIELCNDDYAYWYYSMNNSEIDVNLPAGDYFIFVDGYQGFGHEAGNFQLIIDLPN
jgi:hypothetical protein